MGAKGKGKGVTLAVFELSAYLSSDITHWAHFVYGNNFTPPLENVNVHGGPLHPKCPKGDTCPAAEEGYAGDIEVDADIETQLTISPDAAHIIVYNAPNDETGQTELAEYTRIANDDSASAISSSWGECESEEGAAMAKAEDVVVRADGDAGAEHVRVGGRRRRLRLRHDTADARASTTPSRSPG